MNCEDKTMIQQVAEDWLRQQWLAADSIVSSKSSRTSYLSSFSSAPRPVAGDLLHQPRHFSAAVDRAPEAFLSSPRSRSRALSSHSSSTWSLFFHHSSSKASGIPP
ncbi:hypothetical protein Peur_030278 [Populus x canadensis]